jgi:hypothetical protein
MASEPKQLLCFNRFFGYLRVVLLQLKKLYGPGRDKRLIRER